MANEKFTIEVSTSSNNFEAYVKVVPPKDVDVDMVVPFNKKDVMDALAAAGVKHGINETIVSYIVDSYILDQIVCVATAIQAVPGVNGSVKYLFEKEVKNAPVEDNRGFVDYKDLGIIRLVKKGDVIAEITLPTEGETGVDVRGNTLKQIVGKKAAFAVGENTAVSEDGLSIVALCEGNLVYKGNAFVVQKVVTIKGDIDASVGNIIFTGDVIVKGNIFEGFTVKSGGTITVSGDVNGATLEAKGDINIKLGCIKSNVKSEKDISAQFFEYCKLHSDGNLHAQNYVICDIFCGGTVETKSQRGGILGGSHVILNDIEVANIGSKNYVPTQITLGNNALLSEEKDKLIAKIAQTQRKAEDITLIVDFLNKKKKELHTLPEDKEAMLGTSARQKVVYNMEIGKCKKRITEIDSILSNKQLLTVSCKGYIYPGVKITINDSVYKVEHELYKVKIGLDENREIGVSPL